MEPALVVLVVWVFLPDILGVLDRSLRPDLASVKVDPSATGQRVTLQHSRELLQVNREALQQQRGSPAERGVDLIGEVGVALPVTVPQGRDAAAGGCPDVVWALTSHLKDRITEQLQRVLWPRSIIQRDSQRVGVCSVDSGAQAVPVKPMSHDAILRRIVRPASDTQPLGHGGGIVGRDAVRGFAL